MLIVAGMPLVVLLFKIAGLYDRDQLRIVQSTLDEAPALAQLTGLFALSVTILQPSWSRGARRRPDRRTVARRLRRDPGRPDVARWLAGRLSPPERCLVIGEPRAGRPGPRASSPRAARARRWSRRSRSARDELEHLAARRASARLVRELRRAPHHRRPDDRRRRRRLELIRIAKAAGVQGERPAAACSRSSVPRWSSTRSTA